ncbi:M20/M25/M40 family metallo-hydrolase [candidate division KSB1 bacterium]|nr:M20/M25/M40 family metallo-hydrolase [candidate division KSB1 bacterium]
MKQPIYYFVLILLLSIFNLSAQNIHHDLKVKIQPEKHFIEVVDEVFLPADFVQARKSGIHFIIHGNLKIESQTAGIKVEKTSEKIESALFGVSNTISIPTEFTLQHYIIKPPKNDKADLKISLKYQGEIYHPIEKKSEEYARSFSESPGIISLDGVMLAGSSYWIPWLNSELVSFNLEVNVPTPWDVVSQGRRTIHEIDGTSRKTRWESPEMMDEVYLIAAPFTEYNMPVNQVEVMAFLRTPDRALATKYLETTAQYLQMYEKLIGPYPYSKFALIENFWETGYGMPSFTLLGPNVIRFPFILHSSYPHELLHNWWGNSVFVDYDRGNWCEGLTVYLADHLIKEQRSQGVEYRRDALQGYTDYVKTSRDFPLLEFRARHDASSAAIGYNKSMMIYHTLRHKLGDEKFIKAIQLFYQQNKFKKATFQDVQQAFETISGEKYDWFFDQWLNRPGAPELEIKKAAVEKVNDKFLLTFNLAQRQSGLAYRLRVPIAVTLENQKSAAIQIVNFEQAEQTFQFEFANRPLQITIDPEFDVFRRLDRNEIPPAFSQLFGAEKVAIVLPEIDDPNELKAYEELAKTWAQSKQVQIIKQNELKTLPTDREIWFFGQKNPFQDDFKKILANYQVEIKSDSIHIDQTAFALKERGFILTLRHPNNPELTIAWLFTTNTKSLPGLGRKLPHYGKYSYLGFEGDEPTNILKGQWPTINSPMSMTVQQPDNYRVKLEMPTLSIRKALANLAPVFSETALMRHIQYLASDERKGRGFGSPELDAAAEYIANQFQQIGLQPGMEKGSYFQTWEDVGGENGTKAVLKNVIGIIPGTNPAWADQSVVIGAHYDHLGLGWPDVRAGNQGQIHNGADDNASGVAVMIELARQLTQTMKPARSIVFIAFTAEESGLRGSKYFVENYKRFPSQKMIGMLNLDTVGRLNNQQILILGGNSAREWIHIFMGCGYVTGVKHQLVQQDLDASDQMSFIKKGIPAVQLFTGPHADYHRPTDDIGKIDAKGLVQVATFTKEAISYLAERDTPLTVTQSAMSTATAPSPQKTGPRRASLGIMPDFSFTGEGIRVNAITAGTAAEKAGLAKGDILKKIGKMELKVLRDLATSLQNHQPGDEVPVVFERDGVVKEIMVKLTER